MISTKISNKNDKNDRQTEKEVEKKLYNIKYRKYRGIYRDNRK